MMITTPRMTHVQGKAEDEPLGLGVEVEFAKEIAMERACPSTTTFPLVRLAAYGGELATVKEYVPFGRWMTRVEGANIERF
jgi:hypothetical protein